MNKYQIIVNGQNFLVSMEGDISKYGFITYVYVEADDKEKAELQAIDILRESDKLEALVKNAEDDPPRMYVTKIAELADSEEMEEGEPTFMWYEDKKKRWWQFWK